ncbi:MAG: SNF2 helicase associated domain-containing protein [Chthoniobacterales bacterium]|nr:SNF2 helicase associated domain-containing protein [Chthoniobacterales bacterium]
MIALSEKLLSAAGGWQAMKVARELVKTGRVTSASYEAPLLAGEVRDGKTYRAGLRIRTASDVENICTCRESRQWGKICAHSLAVGLAYLSPAAVLPNEPARAPALRFADGNEPGARLVELRFILPPNFRSAWARREVMICIEAELEGRRLMLDALPRAERFSLDEHDRVIIEQLAFSLGAAPGGMNLLPAAAFLQLLPVLRNHERITFGRSLPARIAGTIYRPKIAVDRTDRDSFRVTANNEGTIVLAGADAWALVDAEFREIGSDLPSRLTNLLQEPLHLRGEEALQFFALELSLWGQVAEVSLPAGMTLPATAHAQPKFTLKLEGSLQSLRATLACRYAERPPFSPAAEPAKTFVLRDESNRDVLLLRNLAAEKAAVALLEAAGFAENNGHFELRDPARAARFFAFEFPSLARDWDVSVAPQLGKTRDAFEPAAPTIDIVASGEDWFELKFSVATAGGEQMPLSEIQRLLRSGQNRMQLKNGRQAVFDPAALDDFEQLLRDADPRQRQPGVYRLDQIQAAYLTSTAAEIGAKLVDASRALSRPASTVRDLGPFGEKLRDYQLTGVSWLAALADQNLGGILADEMGLGKTVQTLAFLQLRRGNGAALIICPTSLLANWEREAGRFTPALRLLVIDGSERSQKIASLPGFDLGLTSYGLLRRDAELYAQLTFDSIVLDEAQHIKNPDTQNAQAAFHLRSRQRFVLTGTPMENSVRDLWSLMNFVAPDYLGSRSEFRERYEKPLTNGPEPILQRRLARRLRPFLLRRRKSDVAKELPAKIEQIVPCDLGTVQRATYDALLREIQQGISAGGPNDGATRMKMLTGLLRLRQVCCDLRLLGLSPNEEGGPSAKLDLLDELLEEIIDGGHRVLLFSQFVKMLDLIRERLAARGTAHCYLAGLTKNRQTEVDRFQNDASIPVFLISLKAGGVGLNLSAADTVIHFDPWWNAAVEAQATDRAHRIGQTRVVTSYKLIARATVEEKILKLQNRKRELASAMLENEEPLMNGLTTSDIAELLAP